MSESFRESLRRFNRKERFYVVREATKGGFELDESFKKRLEEKLEITIPAQDVFMAMDYHLDWIYASLFLCGEASSQSENVNKLNRELITATQEDVDLLIAAPDPVNPKITNLIMIEAKGDTCWTNKQATSKGKRLNKIFTLGLFEQLIRPHYLIWSPNSSEKLEFDSFPDWAKRDGKVPHIKLTMDNDLMKITRCKENGKNDIDGDFWRVENVGKKTIKE